MQRNRVFIIIIALAVLGVIVWATFPFGKKDPNDTSTIKPNGDGKTVLPPSKPKLKLRVCNLSKPDAAIEGAALWAFPLRSGLPELPRKVSDKDGYAEYEAPEGRYCFIAEKDGFTRFFTVPEEWTRIGSVSHADIFLSYDWKLAGRVFDALDAEKPIPSFTIYMMPYEYLSSFPDLINKYREEKLWDKGLFPPLKYEFNNPDGSFDIPFTAFGSMHSSIRVRRECIALFEAPGYELRPVQLTSIDRLANADAKIFLGRQVLLEGRLLDNETGEPVAGGKVEIHQIMKTGGQPSQTPRHSWSKWHPELGQVLADTQGYFKLPGLFDSSLSPNNAWWKIRVLGDYHFPMIQESTFFQDWGKGEKILKLRKGGRLAFVVRDDFGSVPEKIAIHLEMLGDIAKEPVEIRPVADLPGQYETFALEPGDWKYRVVTAKPSYSGTVKVKPGQTVFVAVGKVEDKGSMSGKILHLPRNAENPGIHLFREGEDIATYMIPVNGGGEFSHDDIRAGLYSIQLSVFNKPKHHCMFKVADKLDVKAQSVNRVDIKDAWVWVSAQFEAVVPKSNPTLGKDLVLQIIRDDGKMYYHQSAAFNEDFLLNFSLPEGSYFYHLAHKDAVIADPKDIPRKKQFSVKADFKGSIPLPWIPN